MGASLRYLEQDGATQVPSSQVQFPLTYADSAAGRAGNVVGATSTTVTLEAGASERNGDYVGFRFSSGVEDVVVTAYVGSTRRATVSPAFATTPLPGAAYKLVDAKRMAVQNVGDAPTTFNLNFLPGSATDGSAYLRVASDPGALSCPFGVRATLTNSGAGGLWYLPTTVHYRGTARNATGESVGSIEVSAVIADVTQKVTLTWTPPAGATAIRWYRSETAGVYGAYSRLVELAGGSTSYVDNGGTVLDVGAPPVADGTTGGAPLYGNPLALTFNVGPFDVQTLHAGEIRYFWLGWQIAANVPSTTLGIALTPELR